MRCVGSIDRFLRPGRRASRLGVAVFAARARGLRRARSSPPSPRRASVAARRGDYHDCIENRKARLHLVSFEAGLGGLLPYGARRLRRNARAAKESGADPTDYTISPTARSFVPYYTQRLSVD